MGKIAQMFGKNSGRLVKVFKMDSSPIPELGADGDSDGYDRLSYKWTVQLCVALAVISTLSLFVGKPVLCWHPPHFLAVDGDWKGYSNTYCWLSNTYHVPLYEPLPESFREREQDKVIYYRWVTWFFFAQAIVFYLPWAMWEFLNSIGAIDIKSTVKTAKKRSTEQDEEKRKLGLDIVVNQINLPIKFANSYISSKTPQDKLLRQRVVGKMSRARFTFPITYFYLGLKLLFIANSCVALFGTNNFVQKNFYRYGLDLWRVEPDDDMASSDMFPRVTMCDVDIRRLGHVQKYTMQCLLANNYFYEKLFFLLWAWLWIVLIGSIFGLLSLILSVFVTPFKCRHIQHQLINGLALKLLENKDYGQKQAIRKNFELDDPDISTTIRKFVEFLGKDGCLVLRFLSPNALEECEVIEKLWNLFLLYRNENENASHMPATTMKRETMLPGYYDHEAIIPLNSDESSAASSEHVTKPPQKPGKYIVVY